MRHLDKLLKLLKDRGKYRFTVGGDVLKVMNWRKAGSPDWWVVREKVRKLVSDKKRCAINTHVVIQERTQI